MKRPSENIQDILIIVNMFCGDIQTVAQAIRSQTEQEDVAERAHKFKEKYLDKLRTLATNPW
jgi:HD superfamily phosphodiesterase